MQLGPDQEIVFVTLWQFIHAALLVGCAVVLALYAVFLIVAIKAIVAIYREDRRKSYINRELARMEKEFTDVTP